MTSVIKRDAKGLYLEFGEWIVRPAEETVLHEGAVYEVQRFKLTGKIGVDRMPYGSIKRFREVWEVE